MSMRLKRLELIGFKSFANKVTLEFDEGITAIVGPNGSGKSNISDAVRWVLGEQSIKSLRGSKLEDVIFAGSDGKKPLGMAEVQLTLENSDGFLPIDYNEVTITRRVYRSGESDFLINKTPCRLKDIQDLFTDTGLGREGYAIIGQGQIDAILSTNPEERRSLFEETAGIIKYRHRKEKAIKKMEQTEQDIVRIEDILAELNNQLGPLEREATKARKYQGLANALSEAELDLYSLILNGLVDKKDRLDHQLTENQQEGQKLAAQYQDVEVELNQQQEQLRKTEYEMDNLQEQVIELNDQINQANRNIELTEERLKHISNQKQSLQKNQVDYEQEKAKLEEILQTAKTKLEVAQAEYQVAKEKLKSNEASLSKMRLEYQERRIELEEKKSSFLEFIRELADARNFRRNYQQQRNNLDYQLANLTKEIEQLQNQIDDNQRKIQLEEAQLAEIMQRTDLHQQELKMINSLLDSLTNKLQEIEAREGKLLTTYQQVKSRITALQELEDDYEGYSYSVRQLLKQPIPGIKLYGTVGSVIKVPPGLETAIEIALGFGLQNIITPTATDAKLAIEWLKRQKAGRATFLPLDTIKSTAFPEDYKKYWQIPKCLGPAIDLIEFDSLYLPAIQGLLGRIIIVEDLDTALKLQNMVPSFSRIVTVAGDVVMPNGSLTGGSINPKTTGLLKRKTEIHRLELQLADIQTQITQINTEKIAQSEQLVQAQNRLEQANEQEYRLRLEMQKAQSDLEQLQAEKRRLSELYAAKKTQLYDLETTIQELEDQSASAQKNIINLENEEIAKRQQIADLEELLTRLESFIEEASKELTEEKVALTSLHAGLKELEWQLANDTEKLTHTNNLLARTKQEYTLLHQQEQELNHKLSLNQAKHQQFLELKSKTLEQINQEREQRASLQGHIDINNDRLKKLRSALGKIDKAIYNVELELNGINLEYQRISEALSERQETLENVVEREVSRSQTELQAEVARLKDEIRLLGIVNLGSLQEYESVKERAFFLQTQLEDVKKAKQTLLDVIQEMDSVSAERFMETYEQLRAEFKLVFGELFEGGAADIILVDPEDPLNTGIEIIAQPPGKKLQNLALLSGGERSLTAIALLLAIRRVKPTPFCILDEVDAALDEANLERFADILQGFAKTTQFLIITHRQATMEKADRLYGVTMGESATSQLISVKLS